MSCYVTFQDVELVKETLQDSDYDVEYTIVHLQGVP